MEQLRRSDPRIIGRCTVFARLGAGAGGTVFLGRTPGNRLVAVKLIHPHLARDPDFRRRFDREVAAARVVGGFHTAAVIDAGWSRESAWLATEYIPAPSLEQLVGTLGPMPADSVVALGRGIAESLSAIHAAGVVHRDLKPSNVLVTADGPRVIDFGMAGPAAAAHTGVVGTPGYLAPEQAMGETAGPGSDVFSLGALLAYAATGRGVFGDGEPAVLLYRTAHQPPNLDGLPDGPLRAVVTACVRPDPRDRPTPAEVMAALPHIGFRLPPEAAELVAAAERMPVADLQPAPMRSRRTLLFGAAAGAMILLPGIALAVRAATRPDERPEVGAPATTTPPVAVPVRPERIPVRTTMVMRTLALSADGRLLFVTGLSTVAVIDTATDALVRSVTIAGADHLTVSPDGSRIYAFRATTEVAVYDGSTGVRLGTVPGTDSGFGIPSHDGSRLYIQNGKTLATLDAATNSVVGAPIPLARETAGGAITADGRRMYAVEWSLMTDPENRVSVLDLNTAAVVATIDVRGRARAVALSADGRRAAVVNWNNNELSVIDTATDTVLAAIDVGDAGSDVALSPDGARAFVSIESAATVVTVDTVGHAVLDHTRVDRGPVASAVSADGRKLYVACRDDNTVTVVPVG
ncbi:protein kinase domain-containing protein [Nocardia wallacei]|uniref:protein kinase domain-containing protein n=1 Tax=Nocardia wallacei TaxID=480035 RepID=UPI002457C515|nr:protein kinase [Nocardia wallacei]